MEVTLLYNTPLWVASKAIRKCWASEDKSDTYFIEEEPYHEAIITHGGLCDSIGTGPKDKALIERVGNKNKHSSTLEHLNYSFDIDGISRACLQEVARHRHASLSVKSTRYTLKELRDSKENFLLSTYCVNHNLPALAQGPLRDVLNTIRTLLKAGYGNDYVKHLLPEAYKTSLVWTINARSLQNFLALRTNKAALWEIRDLANELYNKLPEEHKYLFTHCICKGDTPHAV